VRERAARPAAVDEFFLRPYDPGPDAAVSAAAVPPPPLRDAIERKPARRGALLGGIKKVPSES
jgi:hypothetical protein